MLKYPSVKRTKGKETKILITDNQPSNNWYGKIKNSKLARLFGSKKYQNGRSPLTLSEFMRIATYWQLPLVLYVYYTDVVIYYGGVTTFVGSIIYAGIISIPLLMLLLFLGNYSKRGYVKLWEMFPILKGIPWTVAIFTVVIELLNVAMAGLSLLYIIDIFNKKVNWTDCTFKGASKKCYPMYPTEVYTKNCCSINYLTKCSADTWENRVWFSTYDFFMNVQLQAPDRYDNLTGLGKIQTLWMGCVLFTWFVIFCFMVVGFEKYRNIIGIVANIIVGVAAVITIATMLFLSPMYPQPNLGKFSHNTPFFLIHFWVPIFTLSVVTHTPGNYVLLGAMSPARMIPTTDAIIIYIIKFFFLAFLMIWISLSQQIIQFHYKILDAACVPLNGLSLIFAAIPDILSRLPASNALLYIWFMWVWFVGTCTALYTMTALLESFMEAFPWITGVRYYFCGILCTICFLCNIPLVTNYHYNILGIIRSRFVAVLIPIIIFLFNMAISGYSVQRIAADYYFTYGKPLGKYWIHTLKLISFFMIGIFIVIVFGLNTRYTSFYVNGSTAIRILGLIVLILTLCPILIMAVWVYLKYKSKHSIKMAILPTPHWGPPTVVARDLRRRFNPKRELQYNSENQTCKHNCLINARKMTAEIKLMHSNEKRLLNIIKAAKEKKVQ